MARKSRSDPDTARVAAPSTPGSTCYFKIKVVDAETKRGVPLIRLFSTGASCEYFTDSNGLIAFYEPGLMGRPVYFLVDGHGYYLEKNEHGERGIELVPESGSASIIEVQRLHPAQRMYRITGQGIFHDTLLLGEEPPFQHSGIDAGVCGQDSTQTTIYNGKLFWIWGDTRSPRHPTFWNFKVTGATSELPGNGGLDPDLGVNLSYFPSTDFTREMVPLPSPYLYWMSSLHTVRDNSGEERLMAYYSRIAAGNLVEKETPEPARREQDDLAHQAMGHGKFRVESWGRAIFNDKTRVFESLEEHPIDSAHQGNFGSSPFQHNDSGKEYLVFTQVIPCVRVPHDIKSLGNAACAEAYTCLKPGCLKAAKPEDLDRDEQGRLKWAWKKETAPVAGHETDRLVREGFIAEAERMYRFTDVASGQAIGAHGMICYNPHRKRWVAVMLEVGGTSAFGEVWYLEADTMMGPWVYARKIVTHNNYSFYNVIQHPYFAKDGGRFIFFEGTYTYTFTHPLNTHPTPRYDYNQIMYKLDLDDARLFLPVPIYRYEEAGRLRYRDNASVPEAVKSRRRAFFAPDRPRAGTVPIHETLDRKTGATILTRSEYDLLTGEPLRVAFYGVPPEAGRFPPMTAPLYEYTHATTGERIYSTERPADVTQYHTNPDPVCLVWRSPVQFDPFSN